jgi:hypothetical protein
MRAPDVEWSEAFEWDCRNPSGVEAGSGPACFWLRNAEAMELNRVGALTTSDSAPDVSP